MDAPTSGVLLLCVVLAAAGLTAGAWWWRSRRREPAGPWRSSQPPAPALFALRAEAVKALGPREAEMLARLARALPEHLVLTRVPLAHFLRVGPSDHAAWASLVGLLQVDLLVCDGQGRPLVVVDLAQTSENPAAVQLRRQKLRVVESAGVATATVGADQSPDVDTLRSLVSGALAGGRQRPSANAAPPQSGREGGALPQAIPVAEAVELSADDLPEFAPTTIFRPDEAVLPPRP